jgi:type II secretory pathway component PulK
MAARFDRLAASQLEVLAMRVPDEMSRADVRDVLGARLADEGLLAEDAITDHLQLVLAPPAEALELADRYVARLRSYLEQRDPALL